MALKAAQKICPASISSLGNKYGRWSIRVRDTDLRSGSLLRPETAAQILHRTVDQCSPKSIRALNEIRTELGLPVTLPIARFRRSSDSVEESNADELRKWALPAEKIMLGRLLVAVKANLAEFLSAYLKIEAFLQHLQEHRVKVNAVSSRAVKVPVLILKETDDHPMLPDIAILMIIQPPPNNLFPPL